ncbi:Hypothetical protein, putative [Bodo saltans]|uniref:Uncharacterized protein n=1 Tax=Bodo saltans TaxID=75058 RepID=A0A0S4JGM4_BODSA|nr:Hypothetical protein, putative [Bodo saltans]|eukprot:CUG90626.1 Hypothetical protein, putative [Bodo saltans]
MEDPNKHHMVSLFAMYDSKDSSNDVILDQAVFCLRKCHDAITAFTANFRFLEAHRQFQHCEDILKERISERKVISLLGDRNPDRDVFAQLEARTFLLQRKFEAKRTAPQQSGNELSPLRERIGPAPSPAHGGGGLLMHKQVQRRLYAASGGRWQASPPRLEMDDDATTWSSRSKLPAKSESLPLADDTVSTVVHDIVKVDADSRAFLAGSREHAEEMCLGPAPPTVVKPDWRQRSQAHVQRSLAVLQSAQEAIFSMRHRQEELTGKRDTSMQSSIMSVQEAQERARTRLSPETKRKDIRPPPLPKIGEGAASQRRASRMAERQAELVKAEQDLTRRLEKNAEKAKKRSPRTTERNSPTATSEGASFAGVVLRELSNVIRARGSQDVIGADESLSHDATAPHTREPLLPPRGPLRLIEPDHKLFQLFADQSDTDEVSAATQHDAPFTEGEGNLSNINTMRARRLKESQHLVSDGVRSRLVERVESLAAAGKLDSPVPALKMGGEEIERILSSETAQSLVYRQSTYFPSLIEPEVAYSIPCWPDLKRLRKVPDWTRLRGRELMTNLELSVSTLRLQCWWRARLALRECKARAGFVYTHVTRHHQELDAVDKITRCFRVAVAKRRVETIRRRVAHVNDQRVDLELNRGVFLEPHSLAAAARRTSSLDTTANNAGTTTASPYVGVLLSAEGGDDVAGFRHSRYSNVSPMQKRRFRNRRSSRAQTIWLHDDEVIRPFMNPFPHIHPHHDVLRSVQRRVAARTIMVWIRGYMFRCLEELQQISDRCMHHILTGEYIPHTRGTDDDDDGWGSYHQGDDDAGGEGFSADPFAGDGLLAKYSGDVMARIEKRWNGEGEEVTDFMQLKHVKLSVLEAERKQQEITVAREHEANLEKKRRAAEVEILELQTRNESIAMMQRVGRGYRRRAALHRMHSSHQSDKGRIQQQLGALRVEKMSLSLSAGGTYLPSPANHRESPKSTVTGARVDSAIMELISKRNPDLLPERREEVKRQRIRNAIAIQRFCRAAGSVLRVRNRAITKYACTIQRWWRSVLRRYGLSRDVEVDLRLDYVEEEYP